MMDSGAIEIISLESLLSRARTLREQGYRMVQISATRLPETVEMTYSFDLDGRLHNLRLSVPGDEARVPSISSIFPCVILYENEIHDLFNVTVEGLAVDFHGKFYQTAVKFPFGSTKPPQVPAPASSPTPTAGGKS